MIKSLKTDDVIFLIGAMLLIILILIKAEESYVGTVAGFFGAHKMGSIVDDKFTDRANIQGPRYDANGKIIE